MLHVSEGNGHKMEMYLCHGPWLAASRERQTTTSCKGILIGGNIRRVYLEMTYKNSHVPFKLELHKQGSLPLLSRRSPYPENKTNLKGGMSGKDKEIPMFLLN